MKQRPWNSRDFQCSEEHYQMMTQSIEPLLDRLHGFIVGQKGAITRTVLALLSTGQRDLKDKRAYLGCGHIQFIGPTGTGKTILCKYLGMLIGGKYKKVQGTPDLMASDITGFEILSFGQNSETQSLRFRQGPVFANVLLVDEINRIPPKAASGLIEAMAEGTVTYGNEIFSLPEPFIVLATMNPSESGGTYSADQEALMDRFMFCENMRQTSPEEKLTITHRTENMDRLSLEPVISCKELMGIRKYIFEKIHIDDEVRSYCATLIDAVNNPSEYDLFSEELSQLGGALLFRQSPPVNDRGMLFLVGAAQAQAFIRYRRYVNIDDVKKVASPVLRTRMSLLSPTAALTLIDEEGKYKTKNDLVNSLIIQALKGVPLCAR